jgi:hypothetical protein
MAARFLLATLIGCILAPAAAWAQGGGAYPPSQPVPVIAPPSYSPSMPAPFPGAAQPPGTVIVSGPISSVPTVPVYPPGRAASWEPPLVPSPSYVPEPGPNYAPTVGPDAYHSLPEGASHWMFSADALWLERTDDRSVILGNTVVNTGGGLSYVTDIMTSTDVDFPLSTGVRFQLGYRFNEINAVELSYFGLQQWSVGRTINGDPVGNTVLAFSPWTQTDALIDGFNNTLGYVYKSEVNNAEFNDRLIALSEPNWTVAGLVGVRYVHVADKFSLTGTDDSTGDFENIDINTANNLIGPQLGVQWTRTWDRFQLVSEIKAGIAANFYSQSYSNLNSSGAISGNPSGFFPYSGTNHGTDVAGVFEFSVLARYRVTDHLWLRGGYQTYYLTGLATGPMQLGTWSHSSGISLDGPSLGMEVNW